MNWQFLHRWYMPFAWITMSSLIAVPLAIHFEYGMPVHSSSELGLPYGDMWVRRDDLLASLMPYTLNLGAAIWLANADGSTRWAAFWATCVGLARLIAPVSLAIMSQASAPGVQHYVDWGTLRYVLWFQDLEMFAFGILLWMAFGRFVGQSGGVTASAQYAEA